MAVELSAHKTNALERDAGRHRQSINRTSRKGSKKPKPAGFTCSVEPAPGALTDLDQFSKYCFYLQRHPCKQGADLAKLMQATNDQSLFFRGSLAGFLSKKAVFPMSQNVPVVEQVAR